MNAAGSGRLLFTVVWRLEILRLRLRFADLKAQSPLKMTYEGNSSVGASSARVAQVGSHGIARKIPTSGNFGQKGGTLTHGVATSVRSKGLDSRFHFAVLALWAATPALTSRDGRETIPRYRFW
jgi:hypothetical protein